MISLWYPDDIPIPPVSTLGFSPVNGGNQSGLGGTGIGEPERYRGAWRSRDDFHINTSIYKGFSMAMLNNQMVYDIYIYVIG